MAGSSQDDSGSKYPTMEPKISLDVMDIPTNIEKKGICKNRNTHKDIYNKGKNSLLCRVRWFLFLANLSRKLGLESPNYCTEVNSG